MSKQLAEEFGASGRANSNEAGLRLIVHGDIDDDSIATFSPAAGGFYLIATKEWNASTGAYRGHRLHVVAVPEESKYGTVACQRINTLHSDNYGVSITYNSDSTIDIERSAVTYAVRYAIYKVF